MPGKAAKDDSSAWAPTVHVGDPEEAPDVCFGLAQSWPTQLPRQQTSILKSSLAVSITDFQINLLKNKQTKLHLFGATLEGAWKLSS